MNIMELFEQIKKRREELEKSLQPMQDLLKESCKFMEAIKDLNINVNTVEHGKTDVNIYLDAKVRERANFTILDQESGEVLYTTKKDE